MSEDDDGPPLPDQVPGTPHPRETARLFGQSTAEDAFLAAWAEGRLHHAWLLRGPEGVGKATLAYRIARAILAEGPGDAPALFGGPPTPSTLDMPEECPIAARIRAGSEPRLSVLRRGLNERTGKPRAQIVVDDVRAVKGFLQLSAADGGWRAVIVDPADALNRSAANAILKFLEEPPAQTLILLISHAPGGLLPTIRSRCRTLDLAPLAPTDLSAALIQAGVEIDPAEAPAMAELAAGSVGRALRLAAGDGLALYARLTDLLAPGRVDRHALGDLAEIATGREGAALYPLVIDLTQTLVARLARAAALAEPLSPASPHETALALKAAAEPAHARLWAEAATRAAERFRHAVAVNLDPAQTIIDTFLDLDDTLGRAQRA